MDPAGFVTLRRQQVGRVDVNREGPSEPLRTCASQASVIDCDIHQQLVAYRTFIQGFRRDQVHALLPLSYLTSRIRRRCNEPDCRRAYAGAPCKYNEVVGGHPNAPKISWRASRRAWRKTSSTSLSAGYKLSADSDIMNESDLAQLRAPGSHPACNANKCQGHERAR